MVPLEPQVFALLRLLIENRERLVTKDEIVEQVWDGRIVSDAAITSRIKSARQAVGDDGVAQRRDPHRRTSAACASWPTSGPSPRPRPWRRAPKRGPRRPRRLRRRPSIAVLPFSLVGVAGPYQAIADALPHDLIVELSRLRWLFVIARGSSFQFRGADGQGRTACAPPSTSATACPAWSRSKANGSSVTVELCDTGDGGVVWSETYRGGLGAVHEIRAEIVQRVSWPRSSCRFP